MNSATQLILISLLYFTCSTRNNNPRNFSFENWIDNIPSEWYTTPGKYGSIRKDSNEAASGNYSLSITKSPAVSKYVYKVSQSIAVPENTGEIILSAQLKGKEIKNGYAGIFYTVLTSTGEVLSYEDFTNNSIQGTTEWETLTTTIKIVSEKAQRINFGAWFLGSGELWVDDIQLKNETSTLGNNDLVPIQELEAIDSDLIIQSSEAIPSKLSDIQIDNISRFIQYWGFLKYYHPGVYDKDIKMDSLFYENLPAILNSTEVDQFYTIITKVFEDLGTLPNDIENDQLQSDESLMKADLHDISSKDQPIPLLEKIRQSELIRQYNLKHKYIEYDTNGRIRIINENLYNNDPYPDKSVRLLALARFWNIINYFYPYRYLISEDWKSTLLEFIPRILNTQSDRDYAKEFLVLMARLNDGHVDIVNYNTGYDSLLGSFRIPIRGIFVQEQLIVQECLSEEVSIQPSDRIYKIDDVMVDSLISSKLEMISGSNRPAKLHKMIGNKGSLLRSNQEFTKLSIERDGKFFDIVIKNIAVMEAVARISNSLKTPAYEILKDSIGYINSSKIKNEYFQTIKKAFEKTTSIIIDLRCYPNEFLPFGNYANWLIPNREEFTLVVKPATTRPGAFYYSPPQITGYAETYNTQVPAPYSGKVYILVDINTISQAEHAAMAFGIGKRATVVGEQTAGTNGDVIRFWLPGNIQTMISGVGIYYPDGKEVQRAGVKVDIPVSYTKEAIAKGRDAILEKTIEIIVSGDSK